ncbi:hypothetical protein Fmac_032899 [Flemingia macrophylla]|uniref:Uncharacterized protein n=1 Tax=Flemingia macrophylla TaxID=520843 RepID=A0ABD1L6M7_9FABA
MLEGTLDPLVNLVTQLAASQKPASIARVCGIRSSNDHHTSVCPSSQQSGVDEHPEAYVQTPIADHQRVHDVATGTSALKLENLEGKLDSLVNLVTRLVANEKPDSVARQFSARNDAIVIRGVQDLATDTSDESRKLEGKLVALVKLVTQLAANQKPGSIVRVCGIRSSNDHHLGFVLLRKNLEWMSI